MYSLGNRVIFVITVSMVSYFVVKPSWFRNHPIIWSMMRMIYFGVHGPAVISLSNRLELIYQGSFLPWLIAMFIEIHATLGGNMLEEMTYQDMGVNYEIGSLNGYWDNIGSYLPYTIQFPVILAVQY